MSVDVRHRSTFIDLPRHELQELVNMKFSVPKIANLYAVSIKTVRRRMKDSGISIKQTYTRMSNAELDEVIARVVLENPNLGIRLIKGLLWSDLRIRVPEERLRQSLRRVDPVGVRIRLQTNRAVVRRVYSVPYSNYLRHFDSYLKLNRYNIVIRGAVDGKSRMCVYLEAGGNNKAISSLESFLEGVKNYGLPSHTRSDKGAETVLIARFMLMARGLQGHFTGKSTRNQRIERMWRDVRRITQHYYNTLAELELEGFLDIDNPLHMHLLHWVYIPRLNDSLRRFQLGWNDHPLSTEGNCTPNQLFIMHRRRDRGDEREYNWNEIQEIVGHVLMYAPADEPEDRVRYLQDPESALNEEQQRALSNIDVLRESLFNGKDVFVDCLRIIGIL